MNLLLEPDVQAWVDEQIQLGKYPDAQAMVNDALRRDRKSAAEYARRREELIEDIDLGLEDIRAGRTFPMNEEAYMRILQRAKELRAEKVN